MIANLVTQNANQPSTHRSASVETVACFQRSKERFLHQIFSVGFTAHLAESVVVKVIAMLSDPLCRIGILRFFQRQHCLLIHMQALCQKYASEQILIANS